MIDFLSKQNDNKLSKRQRMLGESVKRAISTILKHPHHNFKADFSSVSITRAVPTKDVKMVKVYCYCFDKGKEFSEQMVSALRKQSRTIMFLLGKEVMVRYVPEVVFYVDDILNSFEETNNILSKKTIHVSDDAL